MLRNIWLPHVMMIVIVVRIVDIHVPGVAGQCTEETRPQLLFALPFLQQATVRGLPGNNTLCEWKVKAVYGHVIVKMKGTRTDGAMTSSSCGTTPMLRVYDGGSSNASLLGAFCGNGSQREEELQSTRSTMFVSLFAAATTQPAPPQSNTTFFTSFGWTYKAIAPLSHQPTVLATARTALSTTTAVSHGGHPGDNSVNAGAMMGYVLGALFICVTSFVCRRYCCHRFRKPERCHTSNSPPRHRTTSRQTADQPTIFTVNRSRLSSDISRPPGNDHNQSRYPTYSVTSLSLGSSDQGGQNTLSVGVQSDLSLYGYHNQAPPSYDSLHFMADADCDGSNGHGNPAGVSDSLTSALPPPPPYSEL